METKLSIFLCFYALLLVFVVTITPFEDEKQYGETKEPKKDIRINGYLHNLGKGKDIRIISFLEGRKEDGAGNVVKFPGAGNVVKFPSGGRWGYGGKVINLPEVGKGGRRNIIIFPGVD
ncbi:unnamed protein product [Lathyrus sativus]|nr:unnamed protein product [Lathyrus sativus]